MEPTMMLLVLLQFLRLGGGNVFVDVFKDVVWLMFLLFLLFGNELNYERSSERA